MDNLTTKNETKLKELINSHLPGTFYAASWLERHGISRSLQKHYRKSGWLETVGTGAFKRPGEEATWQGALYTLQTQNGLPVHVGALTALSLHGYAHYVRLGGESVFLFSPLKTNLPGWFKRHEWNQTIQHCKTSVLPPDLALSEYQTGAFSIKISTPERALLECLYLSPQTVDLMECYQLMEGLTTLRPKLLQPLLEQCRSVKVKRLFLYMAGKLGHVWAQRLDASKLDLGTGARSLIKGGVYLSDYQLTVPKELAEQ